MWNRRREVNKGYLFSVEKQTNEAIFYNVSREEY